MDRNAKVRVMTFARALMRRTEPGKHYGAITAKAMAVLEVLLWGFHNARNGLCFQPKETARWAGCESKKLHALLMRITRHLVTRCPNKSRTGSRVREISVAFFFGNTFEK
jgi:hypothetical protein